MHLRVMHEMSASVSKGKVFGPSLDSTIMMQMESCIHMDEINVQNILHVILL